MVADRFQPSLFPAEVSVSKCRQYTQSPLIFEKARARSSGLYINDKTPQVTISKCEFDTILSVTANSEAARVD